MHWPRLSCTATNLELLVHAKGCSAEDVLVFHKASRLPLLSWIVSSYSLVLVPTLLLKELNPSCCPCRRKFLY